LQTLQQRLFVPGFCIFPSRSCQVSQEERIRLEKKLNENLGTDWRKILRHRSTESEKTSRKPGLTLPKALTKHNSSPLGHLWYSWIIQKGLTWCNKSWRPLVNVSVVAVVMNASRVSGRSILVSSNYAYWLSLAQQGPRGRGRYEFLNGDRWAGAAFLFVF